MKTATAKSDETAVPNPRDYTNYGDCALNLPPDWSRSRMVGDASFVLTTIGHEGGVSDVFLTMNPGQAHQFTWCDPKDQNKVSVLRSNHYVLCSKADWTKNPQLWEWDGEGHIVHNGQLVWAREKVFYDQDQAEQKRLQQERDGKRATSADEENTLRRLEQQGAILEDERGRPLKPLPPK